MQERRFALEDRVDVVPFGPAFEDEPVQPGEQPERRVLPRRRLDQLRDARVVREPAAQVCVQPRAPLSLGGLM